MSFIYAVILLGILIFVHELGHFLFAKMMNVKVLKFSLGFGPKLLGKKYGETEYLLSAVPLGGYVKMLGQSDTPGEEEEIPEEEKQRAYNFKPVWKRFVIVLSGPVFNLFFAAVLFVFIFLSGVPYLLPEVGEVLPDSAAARSGLLKGDVIAEINGARLTRWDEMTEVIHNNPEKQLSFKIKRTGELLELTISPEKKTVPNIFGENKEVGLIGIKPSGKTDIEKKGPAEAIPQAFIKTWELSVLTLTGMIKLIQRIIPAESIGGPILILQMAGQQAAYGAMSFFSFMALISINLGVLNLLPIPILDGGHALFLGIEAVRRKPLSTRTIMLAQKAGLVVLIILMVFAFYNDIMRLITGKTIAR